MKLTIHQRIRAIGVKKVAEKLGVTPAMVTNWNNRKSYPVRYILKICEIIGMTADEFLRELEEERKENK